MSNTNTGRPNPRMATASSHAGEGLSSRFSQNAAPQGVQFFSCISPHLCGCSKGGHSKERILHERIFHSTKYTRCACTSLEVPVCLWCQRLTTRTLQLRIECNKSSIKSSFADDKHLKKLKQSELTNEGKSKAKLWRKTLHSSLNFRKGRSGFCSSGAWLPVPLVIGRESPVCPPRFFLAFETFQKCFCVLSFASKNLRKLSAFVLVLPLWFHWFHFTVSFHDASKKHSSCVFFQVVTCVLQIMQFDTICVNSVHVSSKHVSTRPAHASQTPPPSLRHLAAAPPVAIKPTVDFVVPGHKIQKNFVFFQHFSMCNMSHSLKQDRKCTAPQSDEKPTAPWQISAMPSVAKPCRNAFLIQIWKEKVSLSDSWDSHSHLPIFAFAVDSAVCFEAASDSLMGSLSVFVAVLCHLVSHPWSTALCCVAF